METGSGTLDYSLAAVGSKELNDFVVHGTLGYIMVGGSGRSPVRGLVSFGLATTFTASESISIVGEVTGVEDAGARTGCRQVSAMIGGLLAVSTKVTLDVSSRLGVAGNGPEWVSSVGFTLTL
jgi:hypothetical protein